MEDETEGWLSIGTIRGTDFSHVYEVVEVPSSETMTSITVNFSEEEVDWLADRIVLEWDKPTALDESWDYWSVGIDNVQVFVTNPNADCDPIPVPYTENFESTPAVDYNDYLGRLPLCWDSYTNGSDPEYGPHVTTPSNSYHYSPNGSNSITMWCAGNGHDVIGNIKTIVLPELDMGLGNLCVSFDYQMDLTSRSNCELKLGYVTGTDYGAFNEMLTIPNSETAAHVTVPLSDFPTSAKRIAFQWCNTGAKYFAGIVGIDNVSVTRTSPSFVDVVNQGLSCKVYPNPATDKTTLEITGANGLVSPWTYSME